MERKERSCPRPATATANKDQETLSWGPGGSRRQVSRTVGSRSDGWDQCGRGAWPPAENKKRPVRWSLFSAPSSVGRSVRRRRSATHDGATRCPPAVPRDAASGALGSCRGCLVIIPTPPPPPPRTDLLIIPTSGRRMQQGLQQQVNRRFRGDGRQGQALFAGRCDSSNIGYFEG
ncbi:uncharacterized protein LOC125546686 [Triticum urartu]|uniref:uncharacterized protein LOC125546686 n=1 Tax=Triticum urartu TaxID=4572 RepID=UPI0020441770|nr:uncharacterized protein LOC125546686 [Triticum urartu]